LCISKDEAAVRFGALLDALDYGAPPEGGIATGMDRTVMILAGLSNARETIAFPKTQTGYDPLLDAPAPVDAKLLEELGLRVIAKPEKPKGPGSSLSCWRDCRLSTRSAVCRRRPGRRDRRS